MRESEREKEREREREEGRKIKRLTVPKNGNSASLVLFGAVPIAQVSDIQITPIADHHQSKNG